MFKRKTKTLLCESTVNTFVFTYIDIYGICTLLLAQFLAWNICFTTLKNVFVYFILFFPYLFCMYVCMYNWIGLCFIIIFFFFHLRFIFVHSATFNLNGSRVLEYVGQHLSNCITNRGFSFFIMLTFSHFADFLLSHCMVICV